MDTLVEKVQGTPTDDVAVILIGYEKQMRDMFTKQNPGLKRRFPIEQAFEFTDFTASELIEIFQMKCQQQNVKCDDFEVLERVEKLLKKQKVMAHFGNAGSVEQLLREATLKAAARGDGRHACITSR